MIDRPPSGITRAFLRAPVYLYRGGLGALLGTKFLYLVHRGRTTGRRRDTVLEVMRLDEEVPEAVVVAAWGKGSDWYRNIMANPPLDVWVGRHHWPAPMFRVLDLDETISALMDYSRSHPRSWRALAPRLGLERDLSTPTARAAVARFPAIALRPSSD